MAKDKLISHGRIAENRKARFNYEIRDKDIDDAIQLFK